MGVVAEKLRAGYTVAGDAPDTGRCSAASPPEPPARGNRQRGSDVGWVQQTAPAVGPGQGFVLF